MTATLRTPLALLLSALALLIALGTRPFPTQAQGQATHTVCPSGCDFNMIQAALNAANDGDTVRLLFLTPHTENDIVIDGSVTVEGLGPANTVIQADNIADNAGKRVFFVAAGHTVILRNFTIRHGNVSGYGGGLHNAGSDLTLDTITIQDNSANEQGGGIFNAAGALTVLNSEIINNDAQEDGGGIYNAGTLYLVDTKLLLSGTGGSGGGLYNSGQAIIRRGELNFNYVQPTGASFDSGGAIYSSGPLYVVSSDFTANSVGAGAVPGTFQGGGAVFVADSELVMIDSQIIDNVVGPYKNGAGLFLRNGQAQISGSTIRDNMAFGNLNMGGGILVHGGALHMESTTIHNNEADHSAGGVMMFATDSAVISNSTISSNRSGMGGGLHACGEGGTQALRNVTISGNEATADGGGIFLCAGGALDLASVTVSQNEADSDSAGGGSGGGIYMHTQANQIGTLIARNSLIAGNKNVKPLLAKRSPDCLGVITSAGYNLIGTRGTALVGDLPCSVGGDATGNLIGEEAFLGPLAENGGPTSTHAIDPLSPAINAADPAGCKDENGALLAADQRGGLRADRCDIGAFERGALWRKAHLPALLAP